MLHDTTFREQIRNFLDSRSRSPLPGTATVSVLFRYVTICGSFEKADLAGTQNPDAHLTSFGEQLAKMQGQDRKVNGIPLEGIDTTYSVSSASRGAESALHGGVLPGESVTTRAVGLTQMTVWRSLTIRQNQTESLWHMPCNRPGTAKEYKATQQNLKNRFGVTTQHRGGNGYQDDRYAMGWLHRVITGQSEEGKHHGYRVQTGIENDIFDSMGNLIHR